MRLLSSALRRLTGQDVARRNAASAAAEIAWRRRQNADVEAFLEARSHVGAAADERPRQLA